MNSDEALARIEASRYRRTLRALRHGDETPGAALGLVEPTDPRSRMLMLYREWVRCRPHQVQLKACVERAMARCRTRIEMGVWR